MAVRTKGRNKFAYRSRRFVWYIENDRYIRIASADKAFAIAYAHGEGQLLKVVGPEFYGLNLGAIRPLYLATPEFAFANMGSLIQEILAWSFDPLQIKQAADPSDMRRLGWAK